GMALPEGTKPSLVLAFLTPFRNDDAYTVNGRIRACSTLLYPNSTAIYLEVVFFLLCGMLARRLGDFRGTAVSACVIGLAVVCGGMVLTFSRSSWFVIPSCSLAVIAVRWHRCKLDHLALAMLAGSLLFAGSLVITAVTDPVMRFRLHVGGSSDKPDDSGPSSAPRAYAAPATENQEPPAAEMAEPTHFRGHENNSCHSTTV